ncbi:MAG TPA: DUF512 domain-containing protein, partial [Gemmatimonadales bacterium]|nr:DUF512 domain-containing protein [Gemmatimonadales bacterium]
SERGATWAFGADELYLRAGLPLPPAETYGQFEQVENGVGAVRFLQQRIAAAGPFPPVWRGRRIGVCTGVSMGRLLDQVLGPLRTATGAEFELLPLTNGLFGPTVTSAGLLPGADFRDALAARPDLDLALIPAEALNDDAVFLDDLPLAALAAAVPMELRPSYDFADALIPDPVPSP